MQILKRVKAGEVMKPVLLLIAFMLLFLCASGLEAQASGLVDDTINPSNEYSKYALDNYQLDFYVDNSWNWLPWNWKDGIGNSVMYGIYLLTNVIWTLSLYISKATGFVVQEAFKLDFISDMAESIGKNIQTLTGVSPDGFSREGFYPGLLLLFVLILGAYVAYVGLIKRETSKAISAVTHFVIIFILATTFIAYSPTYISRINEFSSDVSTSALSLGTKIVLPESDSRGKDSTDLIRDSLFSIQVKQPWLILQYGTADIQNSRAEEILSVSPDEGNGETRTEAVEKEVSENENGYMSVPKVGARLGMVIFLFFFNLLISIFVFLLTGMMILSQVMFIVYAMFMPVSLLISMLPTYGGLSKKAVEKLFNTIMRRAVITLVITVAFSISTMFYSISREYPFFLIAFLQIVTFAGIFVKLSDIMGMVSLNGNDEQQIGRKLFLFMRPRMGVGRMSRRLGRTLNSGKSGSGRRFGNKTLNRADRASQASKRPDTSQNKQGKDSASEGLNFGQRMGQKAGTAMDTKDRMKDKAAETKTRVKDITTNAKYAMHSGKRAVKENIEGFKDGVSFTRANMQDARREQRYKRGQTVTERRREMERSAGKHRENRKERPGTVKNTEANQAGRTPVPKTPVKEQGAASDRTNARQTSINKGTARAMTGNTRQPTDSNETRQPVSGKQDASRRETNTQSRKKRENKRGRK